MPATKPILMSLHGRRVGLSKDGKLVVDGKTAILADDYGAMISPQPAPNAVNATATLTIAQLLNGLITSTTVAAVVGTLPTGTLSDAGAVLGVNEGFYWSVINTGATNTFTISAATGHTIVGNAVVALSASGRFFTVKTAANTFVTYRIA